MEAEFTHSPFQALYLDSGVESICGDHTYTIDAGVLTQYITYISVTNTIIINASDMSLLTTGTFQYTISVSITGLGSCQCTGCCSTATGIIVIIDPCLSASLMVGTAANIIVGYGSVGTFTFPSLVSVPNVCVPTVVFSCVYKTGEYSGTIDLCDFQFS